MAFRFKRKEAVSKGVTRIAAERMDHALECLRACDSATAVHGARKDIKKTRAVARLVRGGMKKKTSRRLRQQLKAAADELAAARDAYVKPNTLRALTSHFKDQLDARALRGIQMSLQKDLDVEIKRLRKGKPARRAVRFLRRARKSTQQLHVRGRDWKVIGRGVETSYRRGQRAFGTVQQDPTSGNFHAWRKRAKDLGYHARLLHPLWPEQMDALTDELNELTGLLGEDQDLVVLRLDLIERCAGQNGTALRDALFRCIEQRQRELRARALALGARIYADEPAHFCSRLRGYWKSWRRNKRRSTSVHATP